MEFMKKIASRGKKLNFEKLCNVIKELSIENNLLKEKNKNLNKICYETTQENGNMDKHIKELEKDSDDYYNTRELDIKQYCNAIDKIAEERDTYKEVINIMCNKYDISHDSVLNIIDDLQAHTEKKYKGE